MLSEAHTNLAVQIRKLLNRCVGLHPQYEYNGFEALFYFDDRDAAEQNVIRARRLHRFLTQPLPGLEFFTGRLGEHVVLDETLKGCREILDGKHDGIAEEAFYMMGTIEQVVA